MEPPLRHPGLKRRWPAALLAIGLLLPLLTDWPAEIRIAAAVAAVITLLWQARPTAPPVERRVEAPNSHFNPVGVQHRDVTTRWDGIDLSVLHEVNREIVAELLEKARALGPDFLRPSEVELLDRMAEAASRME